ncbi:hypothetical protein SLE2022_369410 [Rubroshorea leprosula]
MAESDGCRSSSDCSFVWDEQSQLYFHASTGFYHDPNAGWYYSSRDGLYYKFENGNYVLLDYDKVNESQMQVQEGTVIENPMEEELSTNMYCESKECPSSFPMEEPGIHEHVRNVADEPTAGSDMVGTGDQVHENLEPTSEWLEDMLIDLYLSGYNQVGNAAADAALSLGTDDIDNYKLSTDGSDDSEELEEGEWIPEEDYYGVADSSEKVSNEDVAWDEESWRAQYGQVTRSGEEPEPEPEFPVVDLWDWAMVTGLRKDGKSHVARLVGRLVKQSAKVHPSMPPGGSLLKTAPICEVSLDLVRVTTGQVYKLRNPSSKYLASLSSYDSSDPTKDWGFPELSINTKFSLKSNSCQNIKPKTSGGMGGLNDLSLLPALHSASSKHTTHAYRDRAAERRKLHGGFGVGPGQKRVGIVHDNGDDPTCAEDAAAEALNMSFGAGSHARKIMESMGWKEGEALGSTRKGLKHPLQPVGNIGNAGLGWPQTKRR